MYPVDSLSQCTHHDNDGFSFDSFGTSRVAECIRRLGQVGPRRGDAGDLKHEGVVPSLPLLAD